MRLRLRFPNDLCCDTTALFTTNLLLARRWRMRHYSLTFHACCLGTYLPLVSARTRTSRLPHRVVIILILQTVLRYLLAAMDNLSLEIINRTPTEDDDQFLEPGYTKTLDPFLAAFAKALQRIPVLESLMLEYEFGYL
jgi:hypothetical protein